MSKELQSLSSLFQKRLFRIPDYQRGYAWKESQLVDFWEDLLNLHEDRYHYIGLLSLKSLPKEEIKRWGNDAWLVNELDYTANHVVDGQQRLTTFVILLNEIIEFVRKLPEHRGKQDTEITLGVEYIYDIVKTYIVAKRPPDGMVKTYLFGYEEDNPSEKFLRYKIFNEKAVPTVDETYYTKNLKNAKDFFSENIEKLHSEDDIEGINQIYKKLTSKLMFNTHIIDADYDVFVAFETMNNRGKKLTNLELLKNRLIYLTTLYDDANLDSVGKSHIRGEINDTWKELYFQLGRNKKSPLSDDEFLKAHWTIYFNYSRKSENEYVKFLFEKFSAKNIFEKKPIVHKLEDDEILEEREFEYEDLEELEEVDEIKQVSKLEPTEIEQYVKSLKEMAVHWYYSYFPNENNEFDSEERLWIDRLNRIGIGYFRPLVTVIISKNISSQEKVRIYKAIERFIFICFRVGGYQASFGSSDYYRKAKQLHRNEINIEMLTENIIKKTDTDIEYAISRFIATMKSKFEKNQGFYSWSSIRYFLYEYELNLANKHNLNKMETWEIFTKSEKDTVSIEHILPQTPSKYYWQNQYRQFNAEEIRVLSAAVGNLLPLSQKINSSLQNDSFVDKKTSKIGRRSYENGCHAEIEVSKTENWTAVEIYNRSKKLLEFMEWRWKLSLTSEELEKLIYVSFAIDEREIPEELPKEESAVNKKTVEEVKCIDNGENVLGKQQLEFWKRFIDYCDAEERKEMAPNSSILNSSIKKVRNWHNTKVVGEEFHTEFTITRSKYITLVIYARTTEAFLRLENKKSKIENAFGDKLDWYSSGENGIAKRILYRKEAEIYNPKMQNEIFAWMIDKLEALTYALVQAGEIDENYIIKNDGGKFEKLKAYLKEKEEETIQLSFSEIENIIDSNLCKSAYEYKAYWNPSPTHTLPNIILSAGYRVTHVDLISKLVSLVRED